MQPFTYEAVLVNPKPVGNVRSAGHFGRGRVIIRGILRSMGAMSLRNADLSSIHGLEGFWLRRVGLTGRWRNISVEGR